MKKLFLFIIYMLCLGVAAFCQSNRISEADSVGSATTPVSQVGTDAYMWLIHTNSPQSPLSRRISLFNFTNTLYNLNLLTRISNNLVSSTVQNPTATQNGYAITWDNANTRYDLTEVSGALTVQDEGISLSTDATILNFTGAGVTASGTGSEKTINVSAPTITGSPVDNQVAVWGPSSALEGSANLTFDGTTLAVNGGIGTQARVDISGAGAFNVVGASVLRLVNTTAVTGNTYGLHSLDDGSFQIFENNSSRLSINTAGNIAISDLVGTGTRIVTADATGILTQSANLTFDGTTLAVNGSIDVDNIAVDGNTISSTNTNGNISLSPNGTGTIITSSELDAQARVDISGAGAFNAVSASTVRLINTTAVTGNTYGLHSLDDGSFQIHDNVNTRFLIEDNGDISLGNLVFDADQTVGSGQDNYVLTYDHPNTQIALEALPALTSGTYTPTLTNITNTSSLTAQKVMYTRIGNIVTVYFDIDWTSVTQGALVQFRVSLPPGLSSNFTVSEDCIGVVNPNDVTGNLGSGTVEAETTNNEAGISFRNSSTNSSKVLGSFRYEIE